MQLYTVYLIWKLLYMFQVAPPPIIRSAYNYLQHLVLVTPLLLSAAIVEGLELKEFPLFHDSGRPDHDQQHCYHHAPKVKPEVATAVVELMMMGVRMPETC
jgi:hypothetical protein